LCSNETVDIFKEDMEDLGVGSASDTGRLSISDLNKDVKTFHPTADSDSHSKTDKDNQAYTVSNILWCPGFDKVFLISYASGKTFEKRLENVGRSAIYKISFWNCEDQMTPLFTIFMQHEITAMQFHPLSRNLLICGTASGQVLLINLLKNF